MKTFSILALFASALFMTACSSEGEAGADGEGTEEVKAVKIEKYVEPVADHMKSMNGIQLGSFFDGDTYKAEAVTLEAKVRSTGSSGSNAALFVKEFSVKGVAFEPFILVSDDDKKQVVDALDKLEKEGKEEVVTIVFEAKLVKDGSYESPFGHQMKLKFEGGKIISVK